MRLRTGHTLIPVSFGLESIRRKRGITCESSVTLGHRSSCRRGAATRWRRGGNTGASDELIGIELRLAAPAVRGWLLRQLRRLQRPGGRPHPNLPRNHTEDIALDHTNDDHANFRKTPPRLPRARLPLRRRRPLGPRHRRPLARRQLRSRSRRSRQRNTIPNSRWKRCTTSGW